MGGVSTARPVSLALRRRRLAHRRRGPETIDSELNVIDGKLAPLVEQMLAQDAEHEMVVLLQRIEELLATGP